MRRRRSAWPFLLGTVCWVGLAAAAAGTVVVFADPGGPAHPDAIDLIRSAPTTAAHWQVQPIAAGALPLFLAGTKGPRADIDLNAEGDGAAPWHMLYASMPASASEPADSVVPATSPRKFWADGSASPQEQARETSCLTEVIYHEGRGQPVEALIAVGQTVINRALSGAYPATLCGVVSQRHGAGGDCQYSFVCDGLSGVSKEQADWQLAGALAARLLSGAAWIADIGDATHFHPLAEHPAWSHYLQRVKRIGGIVFYRGDFTKAVAAKAAITVD